MDAELPEEDSRIRGDLPEEVEGGEDALAGSSLTWPETEQEPPESWPEWVLAAHLLRLDVDKVDVAAVVGVDRTTLWRWRKDERWETARQVAKELWAEHAEDLADWVVLKDLREGDGVMARFVKKHLDPRFQERGGQQQDQTVTVEVNMAGPDRHRFEEKREIELD